MAQPVSWGVVEGWIALLFMGLGAAALACLVLGAAAGSAWRLFMVCSGQAVVWRGPRRNRDTAVPAHLADLLGAGDTADLGVTVADGQHWAIDRSGSYPPALYTPRQAGDLHGYEDDLRRVRYRMHRCDRQAVADDRAPGQHRGAGRRRLLPAYRPVRRARRGGQAALPVQGGTAR